MHKGRIRFWPTAIQVTAILIMIAIIVFKIQNFKIALSAFIMFVAGVVLDFIERNQ